MIFHRIASFVLYLCLLALLITTFSACGPVKKMNNMDNNTSEMNQKMTSMNKKLDETTQQMKLLGSMNTSMTQMIEVMTKMLTTMSTMNDRMAVLEKMNDSMHDLVGAIRQMMTTLVDVSKKMDELKVVSQGVTDMKTSLGELKTDIQGMSKKMDVLDKMNSNIEGMAQEMKSLLTAITQMDTRIASMDKTMGSMDNKLNDMTAMKTELVEVNKRMQTLVTNFAFMLSSLDDFRLGASVFFGKSFLTALDDAPNLEAKMGEAVRYNSAFEFQLWRGEGSDNEATRLSMFNTAMLSFFEDVAAFYDPSGAQVANKPQRGRTRPDAEDTALNDNDLNNLYAVAATLHRKNPRQENWAASHKDFQTYSVFDLIRNGLIARHNELTKKGPALVDPSTPAYIREVAKHDRMAVQIMQMRYNMIVLIALKKTTNFVAVTTGGVTPLGNVKLDKTVLNDSMKVGYASVVLDYALETKNLLKSIGEKPAPLMIIPGVKDLTEYITEAAEPVEVNEAALVMLQKKWDLLKDE